MFAARTAVSCCFWTASDRLSTGCRVGAPGANIGDQARAVLVDGMVQRLLELEVWQWQQQAQQAQAFIQQLTHNIAVLQMQLSELHIPVSAHPGTCWSAGILCCWTMQTGVEILQRSDAGAGVEAC